MGLSAVARTAPSTPTWSSGAALRAFWRRFPSHGPVARRQNAPSTGGWEEWAIDLSAYAGSAIEVSISYASDWAAQGLGAFVDEVGVSTEPGVESFETGFGAWTVAGPPPGSAGNPNDWERTLSVGFEEGAVTSTGDTLYFGFGFEGITGADIRAAVMERSMQYLLGP